MPRTRGNGGFIGKIVSVTYAGGASGVFQVPDQELYQVGGTWPFYYDYVGNDNYAYLNSMLVHADGSNAGANNTFVDSSGYTPYAPITGTYSYYFNGSNYLTVPHSTFTDLSTDSPDFTIEFWLYPTNAAASQSYVLTKDGYSGVSAGSVLIYYDSGTMYFNLGGAPNQTSTSITNNTWTHWAFVRSGTNMYLFKNGVLSGTVTGVGTITDAGFPVYIGGDRSGINSTNGYMSNIRIVKGTALYTSGFTAPSTATTNVSNTVLLTAQSATIVDNGSGGAPFASTNSYYFDGSSGYLTVDNQPLSTNNFTIEGWFYPTTIPASMHWWGQDQGGGSVPKMILYNTGGNIGVDFGGGFILSASVATYLPKAGVWYHIAVVRTGTGSNQTKMYINGVLAASGTMGDASGITNSFNIGWVGESIAWPYFTGYISNFRILNGVAAYTGAFTVPTSPLSTTQTAGTNIAAVTSSSTTSLLTCQAATISDGGTYGVPFAGTYSDVFKGGNAAAAYYLEMPWSYTLDLATGSPDFTIEFWVKFASVASGVRPYYILNQADITGLRYGSYSFTKYTSTLYFGLNDSGYSGYAGGSVSATVSAGTWYHVAGVRSGNTIYLYINGSLAQSSAVDNAHFVSVNPATTNIGTDDYNGSSPWDSNTNLNGSLSNIRIVRGLAVYSGNFTPPTTALTATQAAGTNIAAIGTGVNNGTTVLLTAQSSSVTTDNSGGWAPFTGSYSFSFNGTSQYLTYPSSSTFAIGTSDFTVEAWVLMPSIATNATLCEIGPLNTSGNLGIFMSSSALVVRLGNGSGSADTVISSAPTLAVWVHIAVVRLSGAINVYYNGVSQAKTSSVGASTSLTGTQPRIGYSSAGTYFKGLISNFRIVKGTAVYTSNFTPPTSALTNITNTVALTAQSATIIDTSTANSGAAWTITNTGTVTAGGSHVITNGGNVTATSGASSITNTGPVTVRTAGLTITNTGTVTAVDGKLPAPTRSGSTTQGSLSPFSQTGWSNYFGGQQTLSVGSGSTAFNLTGDFTVEAWVYVTVLAAGDWGIIDARASGQTATAWLMTISSGGKIQFYDGSAKQGTTTVTQNVWHHIVWQRTGSVLRGFLDGVLDYYNASYGTSALSPGSTTPVIGTKDYTLSGYGTTGYISNLRLVNGSTVYSTSATTVGTSVFTPSVTPLTAITNTTLLACQDNRFRDNSVNGFAITIGAGTPSVQPFSPFVSLTVYSTSSVGGSAYFNGSTDYLTASSVPFTFGTGDFTIEAWIYTGSASTQRIVSSSGGQGDLLLVNSGSNAYLSWFDGTDRTTGSNYITLNAWNHVAVTRTGTSGRLFINGVVSGTFTSSVNVNSSITNYYVGTYGPSPQQYFNGYISNLRVTKGTAVYTADFTLPTAPVTAVTGTQFLLNGTNASIYDSMAKNDIITVGSCQLSTTQSKFGGSSIYFGGAGNYLYSPSNSMLSFGTGDFTIEFWIYPTAAFSTTRVFSTYTGGIAIYPNNSGNIVVDAYGVVTKVTTSSTVSINTWTHIAVVRSSGTTTVYIGGVSGGSAADSANYTNTGLYIGSDNGTNGYTGYLDEIRIARYARYTANFIPKTSAFQNQ